jgi:hypothetical protein
MTKEEKTAWFDRAWAAFHASMDDEMRKISTYQVRELFRIMYVTRPSSEPDQE